MSQVLVLVEHSDGAVKKVTLELLTMARAIGEPAAVFIGSGADAAADKLAEYGAATIYVADAAELNDYVVAPTAEVLAKLVAEQSPVAVLVAATSTGKEIARPPVDQDQLRHSHRRHRAGRRRRHGDRGAVHLRWRHGRALQGHHRHPADRGAAERHPARGRPGRRRQGARQRGAVGRGQVREDHRPGRGGEGRAPGTDRGLDRRLRRPRCRLGREHGRRRASGRLPRRGRRRLPRRRRRRLVPAPVAGRADRQDRLPEPLHRRRASPARSSTAPACRPRRPSSRSTRTARPRSSSSPTTAWSATCTRSSRRPPRRSPSARAETVAVATHGERPAAPTLELTACQRGAWRL